MIKDVKNEALERELAMAGAVWRVVKDAIACAAEDTLLPWEVIAQSAERLNKIVANQKAGTSMYVLTEAYARASLKFLCNFITKEVKADNAAADAFNKVWAFIKKTQKVDYDDQEDFKEMVDIIRAAVDEFPAQEGVRNLARDLYMAAYDYAETNAKARFDKATA